MLHARRRAFRDACCSPTTPEPALVGGVRACAASSSCCARRPPRRAAASTYSVDRAMVAGRAVDRAGAGRPHGVRLGRTTSSVPDAPGRRRRSITACAGPRRVLAPVRAGALRGVRGDPVPDRDRRRGRPAHPDAAVLQAPRHGAALRGLEPERAVHVAERVAGIASVAYALAFSQAVERALGVAAAGAGRALARGARRARADGLPPRRDRQAGRDDRPVRRPGPLSDPQGAGHAAARAADRQPLRPRA